MTLEKELEQRKKLKKYLVSQYGSVCYYCEKSIPYYKLTMDHIYPRIKGGRLTIGNTILCCYPCNKRKGSRIISIDEFKAEVQGIEYLTPQMNEQKIKEIKEKRKKKRIEGSKQVINSKPVKIHIRGPESLETVKIKVPSRIERIIDFVGRLFSI